MKRKNPDTEEEFREGDTRKDGYIFVSYRTLKNSDGYFREDWAHPDVFKRKKLKKISTQKKQSELAAQLKTEGKLEKRMNPKTDMPFERGDIENKKYFWEYRPRAIRKDGTIPEVWLSEEEFNRQSAYFREMSEFRSREGLNAASEGVLVKRLNPKTGKIFVSGDRREKDGWYFCNYANRIQADGFMQEHWTSPEGWLRRRVRHSFQLALNRAIKKKVPFEISYEYLLKIFPEDYRCPVLGIKMHWGTDGGKKSSPSLDRIEPKKGYIEGNVIWISDRANTIKSDGNIEDMRKVLEWIEKVKS